MMQFGRGGKKLRIGYGRIFHEACAYSPVLTTVEDFKRMHHMSGDELTAAVKARGGELAGYMPHAELTGFAAAAKDVVARDGTRLFPQSGTLPRYRGGDGRCRPCLFPSRR